MDESLNWQKVCPVDELEVDDVVKFIYDRTLYAVYRLADGFYATSGKCTHAGATLADGFVIDGQIECPAHQGRFDIRTGKATCSPACAHLQTYPTKVENGNVYIGLPK